MYLLEISEDYPNSYWLAYEGEENLGHMKFKDCIELDPSKVPLIIMQASKKASLEQISRYDYLFSSGPDVVSDRLVKLLSAQIASGEIQVYPAIISNGNEDISGFNIINYLKCEPAIDMQSSSFKPLISSMPNGPMKFLHTVLLNKEPAYEVFRAAENREEIVVSDRLQQTLDAHRVKGIRFVKEKKR